jgi:nitrogen fixation negative regulator NifL
MRDPESPWPGTGKILKPILSYSIRSCDSENSPIFLEAELCPRGDFGVAATGQKTKTGDGNAHDSQRAAEQFINSVPSILIGIDARGFINRWNRAAGQTFGLEETEVLGKPLSNCGIHWLNSDIEASIRDVFLSRRRFVWDGVQFEKQGEPRLLGMTVNWIQIPNSERGELLIVGSDITSRKRTEDELRAKTAFFEAQIQATIDGILVVDENGNILLHNERFAEMFGIPPEFFQTPDDNPVLKYVAGKVQDPGSFLERVEYLYSHRHEKSRDEIKLRNDRVLDRYSSPVFGQDGHYYGRIWTFHDITDRKQNEDALRQLSVAVEQSPVAVIITDLQGNITYVNRRFTECTGYGSEEVIGRNPRLLKSGHTSPEEYRQLWQTITRGEEWRGELRNKKKNGDLYWESVVIRPIRNSAGETSHFLAVKEDITERRQAEKDFRLTSFSLENASDNMFWIDPQGRILYANESACRALGRSHEELTSLSVPDIDPILPREKWPGFWEEFKMRRSMTFETQQRHKEGRVFPIEITANYLEFDGQEYLFACTRDISERHTIQSQLQQAQKMESIGQLAAGIAHEINTPIQFVGDNLRFIKDAWSGLESLISLCESLQGNAIAGDALQQLRRILQESDSAYLRSEIPRALDQSLDGISRVAKIVRAMKEFSHPGSAEQQPADINQAILTTLTVSRNEWKYVADVETVLQPDLQPVPCHISELNQVLLNLLVNSAHAIAEVVGDGSAQKGKITIRTAQEAQFTTITVQDTGAGIRPEVQSRVFDPFFTTKGVGRGTGQGLFLAHNSIVKKHGGRIWFDSEVGKGTTFFIQLQTTGEACSHVETHSVRR